MPASASAPAPEHDIFVSYADVDRAFAEESLLEPLTRLGVRCHSEAAFELGRYRLAEFERAIRTSRYTLLVLSSAYLAGGFTSLVELLANTYGIESASWPVIPLLIAKVELPARLSGLVKLDASAPESWPKTFQRLCAQLGRPGSPVPPAPAGRAVVGPPPAADWTKLLRDAKVHEQLARFRSLFSSASEQIALLTWYKTLHDSFQELEIPYKVLLRERKRLADSAEAWEEVHEYLASTRERIRSVEQVLESSPIRTEFAMCKQQLGEARQGLERAEEEVDSQKLNRALKHLKESLARYPSKANDRLMSLAQSLPLDKVVKALQLAHASLAPSAPDSGALLVMGQKVAALDALQHKLVVLVDEHNQWQGIDNELRVVADSPTGANREAIESSWPLIRTSVVELLKNAGDSAWANELRRRGEKLDAALAALGQPEAERGAGRLHLIFGDYFRCATTRFEDVDKKLLKTCEELQQEGQTLDSVLGVLDGKP